MPSNCTEPTRVIQRKGIEHAVELVRRLELRGTLPSWEAQVLLAEGDAITPQPGGQGWVVGDRDYYIDWPAGAAPQPTVRTVGAKQFLVVRLAKSTLEAPLTYSLVW